MYAVRNMIESDYPPAPLANEPYHETLLRAIKQHIETGKNKIAFINGDKPGETTTFKQVYDNAYSVAAFLYSKDELQRQFVDSGAKVVLTCEDYLEKVLKAVKQSPNVEVVIYIPKGDDHQLPDGVISWNEVVKSQYSNNIPKPNVDLDKDVIMLPYSR
ncbi:hypothetical protein NECAME_17541 [Necator americanus]|uniref:AMP-dependent synthetase/ligase domain-containing protein n=1 Tax=Necator americanus TaxID=51031 RepID=W2TM79_NECAM|nr:hypothetical protein NECAME_17541 [Necator americanus]ETN83225.1 hypothetical protein NECAME_17541 [Necator americanus]